MSIFKKLKHVFSGEKPKNTLVIRVLQGFSDRILYIPNQNYPTFKLLLRDLAEMRGLELEIVEDEE